jgi:hypothetical protein
MSTRVAVGVFVGALLATYLSCMRPVRRGGRPISAVVQRSAGGQGRPPLSGTEVATLRVELAALRADRRNRQPTPGRLG